jgi:membrane peptidoglycan carboxypeptidase
MRRFFGAPRRAGLLLLAAVLAFCLLFGVVVPVPRIVALRFSPPATTAFLEARRARLLEDDGPGRIDRRPVPLAKVSPHLVTAVLVAEDARFFEHRGIDWGAVKLSGIEWGERTWGCEAAARKYFGRSASSLTRSQAAWLAAMIPGPRLFLANPSRHERRAARVLSRMKIAGDFRPLLLDEADDGDAR